MAILNIPTYQGELAAAYQQCVKINEPRFVPVNFFADDRGWSMMNLMTQVLTDQGQINVSAVYPDVVKAWHRHQLQTDFWMVLQGHIRVGIHHEKSKQSWQLVIGEKRQGVVIIPPTLWHGLATVGPETAMMMYYVTKAYDPKAPDEDRRAYDSVAEFTWNVQFK